jgi:hypothetical protein
MYKTGGTPFDLWQEHVRLNLASFSATQVCEDWRTHASIGAMPARLTHVTDTTAYPTQPSEDSWYVRWAGTSTPARVQAGQAGLTSGIAKTGGLT